MTPVNKVSQKEIHWLLPNLNVGEQSKNKLDQLLGSELASHFPKANIRNDDYVWEDAQSGWTSHSMADDLTRDLIDSAWMDLKTTVRSKLGSLGESFVNNILSIPNEDYLYYRQNDDGHLDILVTGWGFRNFKQSTLGRIEEDFESDKRQSVTIVFVRNGSAVPNRNFFIKTPKVDVHHTTGADGTFLVGEKITVGRIIELGDVETGRMFSITVEKGKPLYELDITERTTVRITVRRDGNPFPRAECKVNYNGEETILTTGIDGSTSLTVPIVPGETCSVSVEDQTKRKTIEKDGNEFVFDFETEKPPVIPEPEPEPEPETLLPFHIKVVDASGNPIANTEFSLTQGDDNSLSGTLDNNGEYLLPRDRFELEKTLTFSLPNTEGAEQVDFTLEANENDYLIEERLEAEKKTNWLLIIAVILLLLLLSILAGFLMVKMFPVVGGLL